ADRFWAVLIGINAYHSSPLRGCVSDVEKMEEFLTKDLGVSKDHIQRLLNVTSPTRENIINTLLDLSTNSKILHGDNIIIHFSGHGSSYDLSSIYKPDAISAVGSIEALCPMDRTASSTDSSLIRCIPDISDREINIILAEISRTKGNHITLILDC
ncbi:caspase domain-containing protein, partial [Armillaria mellea]